MICKTKEDVHEMYEKLKKEEDEKRTPFTELNELLDTLLFFLACLFVIFFALCSLGIIPISIFS
jgi:hypothetical protein